MDSLSVPGCLGWYSFFEAAFDTDFITIADGANIDKVKDSGEVLKTHPEATVIAKNRFYLFFDALRPAWIVVTELSLPLERAPRIPEV